MGYDIHGILQVRETANGNWNNIDKHFRWFDDGVRNTTVFKELMGIGAWIEDIPTMAAIIDKMRSENNTESLQKYNSYGACRTLTLYEIQELKKEYEPDDLMYEFISEVEELYDGDPFLFRIVYWFDW